jgi:hypothetical protein
MERSGQSRATVEGLGKLKLRLETALRRYGADNLSKLWGVDESQVSRRLSGDRGMSLDDLAAALDAMGAQLVFPGEDVVMIRTALYVSMLNMSKEAAYQLMQQVHESGGTEEARPS